jgi:hypothetical protein
MFRRVFFDGLCYTAVVMSKNRPARWCLILSLSVGAAAAVSAQDLSFG